MNPQRPGGRPNDPVSGVLVPYPLGEVSAGPSPTSSSALLEALECGMLIHLAHKIPRVPGTDQTTQHLPPLESYLAQHPLRERPGDRPNNPASSTIGALALHQPREASHAPTERKDGEMTV